MCVGGRRRGRLSLDSESLVILVPDSQINFSFRGVENSIQEREGVMTLLVG